MPTEPDATPFTALRAGVVGTGFVGYLQDWLLYPTDWNWRLEPDKGGGLRAIGDIGSHWTDMAQFVSGQRIVEVCADLHTTIPVRRRPLGEVETFSSADDVAREDAPMSTEDLGHVLVRFDGGARGAFKVSQAIAAGGPSGEPDYPTFADGHRANVLGDAIALSNAERRWVEVNA